MTFTIQQALKLGTTQLQHLENPKLEAEVILGQTLGLTRAQLKTQSQQLLKFSQQLRYRYYLWQRQRGTPVAYIFKHVHWNELNLQVNHHTLIPRDETETLCHHIKAQQTTVPSTILDIGTGSGCIAIWLQKQFPKAQVTALDINPSALKVAQQNAQAHKQDLDFKQSNLLTVLPNQSHIDLIVANLPYVPVDFVVTTEVKKEPPTAIFSGADGLEHIRRLAHQIEAKKITFDQLWLEFLPQQAVSITKLFPNYRVTFFTDVSGQTYFAQITNHASRTLPQI